MPQRNELRERPIYLVLYRVALVMMEAGDESQEEACLKDMARGREATANAARMVIKAKVDASHLKSMGNFTAEQDAKVVLSERRMKLLAVLESDAIKAIRETR